MNRFHALISFYFRKVNFMVWWINLDYLPVGESWKAGRSRRPRSFASHKSSPLYPFGVRFGSCSVFEAKRWEDRSPPNNLILASKTLTCTSTSKESCKKKAKTNWFHGSNLLQKCLPLYLVMKIMAANFRIAYQWFKGEKWIWIHQN